MTLVMFDSLISACFTYVHMHIRHFIKYTCLLLGLTRFCCDVCGAWLVLRRPKLTVDKRQERSMLSRCLCQILALPSECHSRNWHDRIVWENQQFPKYSDQPI